MKWKNIGADARESGPWTIINQKTFLNPTAGWAIYHNNVFVARVRTLGAAKIRVEMIVGGKGLREDYIAAGLQPS